jgi:hypothetical protein
MRYFDLDYRDWREMINPPYPYPPDPGWCYVGYINPDNALMLQVTPVEPWMQRYVLVIRRKRKP